MSDPVPYHTTTTCNPGIIWISGSKDSPCLQVFSEAVQSPIRLVISRYYLGQCQRGGNHQGILEQRDFLIGWRPHDSRQELGMSFTRPNPVRSQRGVIYRDTSSLSLPAHDIPLNVSKDPCEHLFTDLEV